MPAEDRRNPFPQLTADRRLSQRALPGVTAPRGVILGLVRLVGCVRDSTSSWAIPGLWHWLLADAVPLPEPVPCKGAQGLWSVPRNLHDQVTAADG